MGKLAFGVVLPNILHVQQLQARRLEGQRQVVVDDAGRIAFVQGEPGGKLPAATPAIGQIRKQGRLAESAGRPQHG